MITKNELEMARKGAAIENLRCYSGIFLHRLRIARKNLR
jgi:hypothetical protein